MAKEKKEKKRKSSNHFPRIANSTLSCWFHTSESFGLMTDPFISFRPVWINSHKRNSCVDLLHQWSGRRGSFCLNDNLFHSLGLMSFSPFSHLWLVPEWNRRCDKWDPAMQSSGGVVVYTAKTFLGKGAVYRAFEYIWIHYFITANWLVEQVENLTVLMGRKNLMHGFQQEWILLMLWEHS